MVSKLQNIGKVKLMVIMLLVFAFSFLLTANAFAEWDIANSNYYGYYHSNRSDYGFVNVREDEVVFFAYLHTFTVGVYSDFITGVSEDGYLSSTRYSFKIPKFDIVDKDGGPTGSSGRNAIVSGTTTVELGLFGAIKSISLTPEYGTIVKYTLTK